MKRREEEAKEDLPKTQEGFKNSRYYVLEKFLGE